MLPDRDGKPYTVRYDAVNAMLLNQFLKEHRKVQQQESIVGELKSVMAQQKKNFDEAVARQRKETEGLVARLNEQEARIQKVSGRIKMLKRDTRMLVDNQ
jgi:predicted nuclease with TOPRIM domain